MTYDDYPPTPDTVFVNCYRCPGCGRYWCERYPHTVDSTCPECGCRNISPYDSFDETETIGTNVKYYTPAEFDAAQRALERRIMWLQCYTLLVTIHGRRNAGINGGET